MVAKAADSLVCRIRGEFVQAPFRTGESSICRVTTEYGEHVDNPRPLLEQTFNRRKTLQAPDFTQITSIALCLAAASFHPEFEQPILAEIGATWVLLSSNFSWSSP